MAQVTITQLPNAGPITGTESVPIVQNGQTVQTTTAAISGAGALNYPFLTVGSTAGLTQARYMSTGSGLSLTDNGAGSTLQINLTGAAQSLNSSGNGIQVKTGLNTVTARSLAVGGGLGITNPDGVSGNPTISLGSFLSNFSSLTGTGVLAIQSGTVGKINILGVTNQISIANGDGSGDVSISLASNPIVPGVGALTLPVGSTSDRPSPAVGQIRYNTSIGGYEAYQSGEWRTFSLSGGITEVDTGLGLTGGPITSSGTISVDTTVVATTNNTLTMTGKTMSGASNTFTNIGNSSLTNSTITINGTTISLGGSGDITTFISPTIKNYLKFIGPGLSTYTPFSNSIVAFADNVNNYNSVYTINLNSGSDASADFVAYNDASDVNSYFIDMGINSSGFSSVTYPIFTPNSGYLITGGGTSGQSSDLFMGTGNAASDIVLFSGGYLAANERARIKGNSGNLLIGTSTDNGQLVQVNGSTYFGGASQFGSTVLLSADPTLALQAATKQYVDAAASGGFTVHPAANLATVAALPSNTYSNGASGVGATLTAIVNGALSVDGVAVSVGNRILVKDEVAASHNGCYTVTATGSAGTPYVLTRSTDFNQAGANEIANNAYFFVLAGTVNAGSSFILSQTAAITVGTTALPFTQFSDQLNYVGGTNIDVTGLTISLTGTVAATNGGTGTSTVTTGDLLYGSATDTWSKLSLGSAYKSLLVNASGTQVEWNAVALNQPTAVSGQLGVGNGGTSFASYAAGDMIYATGSSTLAKLTIGTSGYVLTSSGSAPQYVAQSTLSVGSATNISGGAANQIPYQTGSGATAFITAPSVANTNLQWNGTSFVWSSSAGGVTSFNTRTGAVTLTSSDVTTALGYTPLNPTTSQTANTFYAAPNGSAGAPTFRAIVAADVPTLNQNTTGTASNVTGVVAVANGGTGLSSGTSGGIPYFSGSTSIASSAALAANALVVGGGAGAAPSTVTTGTGVVTALGVNTESAGAFVVNGGALGTPSSGTVTNLTGTASININGTVGATTPTTGAFTNLSYTGTLTGGTGVVNLGSGQFYKDSSGNIGLGNSSPGYLLSLQASGTPAIHILKTATSDGWVRNINTLDIAAASGNGAYQKITFSTGANYAGLTERANIDGSGNFTATGNVTAYSDERLKKDWAGLPADFLERVAKAKVGTYIRIDTNERQAGSSAQDWQKILPEVVLEGSDDAKTLSVAYGNAALVTCVKLAQRVLVQDEIIAALERRLAALEK